jgi:hypothetical protein
MSNILRVNGMDLLSYARDITNDQKLNFDNVGVILHSHYLLAGQLDNFIAATEFDCLINLPHLSYKCTTLHFESSGFKGLALKNFPRIIDGPEYFLRVIPNGILRFYNNYPFLYNHDGKITALGSRFSLLSNEKFFFSKSLSEYRQDAIYLSGYILIISDDCWQPPNYCHWMFDWFTRLAHLENLIPNDEILNIIFPKVSIGKWVEESILFFKNKNPNFNFIYAEANCMFTADKLIVPSTIASPIPHPACKFADWAIDFIHSNFVNKIEINKNQTVKSDIKNRIFIDRSSSMRGSGLVYDSDFYKFIAKQKIKIIKLEDMTISAQRLLFEEAELVIALHGAGLTNLVFCKKGTKVVEIFSPEFGSPAYAMVSAKQELDYYAICGMLSDDDKSLDRAWRVTHLSTSQLSDLPLFN